MVCTKRPGEFVTYLMGNILVPPFISISLTLPSEAKTLLPALSTPLLFVYLCFLASFYPGLTILCSWGWEDTESSPEYWVQWLLFLSNNSWPCVHGELSLLQNGPLKSSQVVMVKGSFGSLFLISSWVSLRWIISLHSGINPLSWIWRKCCLRGPVL